MQIPPYSYVAAKKEYNTNVLPLQHYQYHTINISIVPIR
jgi:hypothetical protein